MCDCSIYSSYKPRAEYRGLMPVDRRSCHYNMNHPKRGNAVIFNHETFDDYMQYPVRSGTHVDCERLEETLKHHRFDVCIYNDLTISKILHYSEECN